MVRQSPLIINTEPNPQGHSRTLSTPNSPRTLARTMSSPNTPQALSPRSLASANQLSGAPSGLFLFEIITPERVYYIGADAEPERKRWLKLIKRSKKVHVRRRQLMDQRAEEARKVQETIARERAESSMRGGLPVVIKEGILFKKGNNRGPKDWKSRWFQLAGETLSYYDNKGDPKPIGQINVLNVVAKPSHQRKKTNITLI